MTGTNTNFEGFSWLYGVDTALGQHACMQESVTGPVGEFDEPKALLGAEPLDDATDGWPGRGLEPGLGKSGSGAERTRLRVEGVRGEVATPRLTEILMSHVVS